MEQTLTLLKCNGLHGTRVYSTVSPQMARLLDGWTTINPNLRVEEDEREDLCPSCSAGIVIKWLLDRMFGKPSCKWAMEHRDDEASREAIFNYDLIPAGYTMWDIDNIMFETCTAWKRH